MGDMVIVSSDRTIYSPWVFVIMAVGTAAIVMCMCKISVLNAMRTFRTAQYHEESDVDE